MFGFGKALDVLRDGDAVQRNEWDPGMFLVLVPSSVIEVAAERPLGRAAPRLVGQLAEYSAHIDLVVEQFGIITITPWPPTQADIMAEDWDYFAPPPPDPEAERAAAERQAMADHIGDTLDAAVRGARERAMARFVRDQLAAGGISVDQAWVELDAMMPAGERYPRVPTP